MSNGKDHFVIEVEIKHVTFVGPNEAERRGRSGAAALEGRFVDDTFHLIMSSGTKYNAIKKVMDHLQVEKIVASKA